MRLPVRALAILVFALTPVLCMAQKLSSVTSLGFSVQVSGAPATPVPAARLVSASTEMGSARIVVAVAEESVKQHRAFSDGQVYALLRRGFNTKVLKLTGLHRAPGGQSGNSDLSLLDLRCAQCAPEELETAVLEIEFRQY